ncbi:MAG: transposase [Candidatus Symbiodolus clandestinus]
MSRQQYTPEFKRRTRELLAENGKSILQVAKELGISENTLYGWRHTAKTDMGFTPPQSSEQALEIKRLKKKISELEEDKLILKKVAALFSKERANVFWRYIWLVEKPTGLDASEWICRLSSATAERSASPS